jgi:hypothetical protein
MAGVGGLDRFQLQDAKTLGCYAFAEVEDLDADHIVGRVVVQHHARLDFLGLDNRGLVEPQIQRITLFVDLKSHDSPLRRRSEKTVTTIGGLAFVFTTTRRMRPLRSGTLPK